MQLVAYGSQDIYLKKEKKKGKGKKKKGGKHYKILMNKKINDKVNKKCNDFKKIKINCNSCDNCAFCLSNLSNFVFETKCGHKYHQKCLKQYLTYNYEHKISNNNCPLCRSII